MTAISYLLLLVVGFLGGFLLITSIDASADEISIPLEIKEKAKLFEKNGLEESELKQILIFIEKEGLIKASSDLINSNQYQIPKGSGFSYVHLPQSVGDYGKSGLVSHLIIKPDNSTIQSQSLVLETGVFVLTFPINSENLPGEYKVLSNFQGKNLEPISFLLIREDHQTIQNHFPHWVKENTNWWLKEKISDKEYLLMFQYLINEGLIDLSKIKEKNLSDYKTKKQIMESPNLKVEITGEKFVRRGTMQTLTVQVTDELFVPINGAKIFLKVEDYGEDIIFDFDGKTNEMGIRVFSWEIPKTFNDIETLIAFIDVTDGFSSLTKKFVFQVYCLPGEKNCEVEGN